MTELTFAQSFLSTIDGYPTRISSDHVEDPRKYPSRPTFNLPKHTQPQPKKRRLNPDNTEGITVHLSSQRYPDLSQTISSQLPNVSILELKNALSKESGIPAGNIKLLHKKKPVPDSKVLKDLVILERNDNEKCDKTGGSLELGLMILGGMPITGIGTSFTDQKNINLQMGNLTMSAASVAAKDVLNTEEFWSDLTNYLTQRLSDKTEGERLCQIFRKAIAGKCP
ncbi:hypothetical protein GcM3_067011 [Golovinomyces cichoracearum]|uniref:Ubiquitin-like domain-containing protein n=1 Tax=Golovinomyces cichoracearum TaxID=62708 RepID=A0A420IU77_9PEZI|nr:hypothetical protein GcM3_067011 [Golovinomyces cichoracearum]